MTVAIIEFFERWRKPVALEGALGNGRPLDVGDSDAARLRANHLGTSTRGRSASVAFVVCIVLVALAGCGSSKPAYCANRANLENSIKGLSNASSGVSGLQSQLEKIKGDATALVSSAKGDFPSQTSAIKSSLDALESAVKGLPSSPSASQIASLARSASGVVSSVQTFVSDSKSKCS